MKYILITVIVTLAIFFIYFFSCPYYYKGMHVDLIGSDVSEIDEKIGVKRIIYIGGKEFIGYPYKKYEIGCGIGYSLTMYTKEKKVRSILNELSFYCNNRKLLSKTQIFRGNHPYTNIFIWPFLNVEF